MFFKKKKATPCRQEECGLCKGAGGLGAVLCFRILGRIEKEGRKETRADVESLLIRLTPLIPMQIPRKGEAEKVVFKAFILNSDLLKNQRK